MVIAWLQALVMTSSRGLAKRGLLALPKNDENIRHEVYRNFKVDRVLSFAKPTRFHGVGSRRTMDAPCLVSSQCMLPVLLTSSAGHSGGKPTPSMRADRDP